MILLLLGLACVGYFGYVTADQYVYQAYQNWAFDQQIAGRRGVTFADYLREKTPIGFLAGTRPAATSGPSPAAPAQSVKPIEGTVLGRVVISRLNLSAVVREGVDDKTLSQAVGHIPSSALPGSAGNFAIAAHRDTLFRVLKDIRQDDLVTFQSPSKSYSYKVVATKIVKPTDVSVIRPDGGGLIPPAADGQPAKLLTMITCYPFYFVGAAPKRFIVQAQLMPNETATPPPPSETTVEVPMRAAKAPAPAKRQPPRHHGFWHKVLRGH